MYSWVRYSIAAYVGLLLAGSLMTGGRQASAGWGSGDDWEWDEGTVEIVTPAAPPAGHRLDPQLETQPDQPSR